MGMGHMRRSFNTSRRLSVTTALVLDDEPEDARFAREWTAALPDFPDSIPVLHKSEIMDADRPVQPSSKQPGFLDTLVIFDRLRTTEDDIRLWGDIACPLLLDDNGQARNLAPFVLDTIPGPRDSEANESSPAWLELPPRRRTPDPSGPILVSFGGDDPAQLTVPMLTSLITDVGISPDNISVTLPKGIAEEAIPPGVIVLNLLDELKQHLGDFGLVICSYGITAWEAIAAGSAVMTADPTPYHAQLSLYSGFPGIGRVLSETRRSVSVFPRAKIRKLKKILEGQDALSLAAEELNTRFGDVREAKETAALFSSLEAPRPQCAACGCDFPPVTVRFPRRSYYRCPDCRISGLYRFQLREDEYGPAYFQNEYRDQYGRSYLEDFASIKGMAIPRLKGISRRARPGGSLLDIGCAFGPFLDAAREAGFIPYGTDVSPEGTTHVRDVLGIPAFAGTFPADNPVTRFAVERFDVVTLWYVIEHFSDLKSVLEALNGVLNMGGVLALSTPNESGISGLRSRRGFLEKSPRDHYTIWNPRVARCLLGRFGFKVYKIRITGHHPERFGMNPNPGSLLFRFSGIVSRIFGLGDTFEVYAVKETSLA